MLVIINYEKFEQLTYEIDIIIKTIKKSPMNQALKVNFDILLSIVLLFLYVPT